MKNTITVYAPGHYDVADSYGLIACQLARGLTRLGVYVNAAGMGKTVMDSQPDDIRAITQQPIRAALGGIFLGYPDGYRCHANPLAHMGPRVAVTMFESSRCPASWIAPLNSMDAVITPSRFCETVFRDSGVTVPIHVVPLGLGESYVYAPRPQLSADRPLTFLTFLEARRGARKGGIEALQAFVRAFGEDTRYKLIIKGRPARQELAFTNPNIEVRFCDLSEAEMYALYCECDVLINPHKGEGFGLLPREFAASGGMALTTDWSGTADGLDSWGYPLPYTLVKADWRGNKHLEGQELGEWAEPDAVGVANKLQTVAANWNYYRGHLPQRAQAALELYSWRAFAEQVLTIWEGVAHGYSHRTLAA